jgi:hypothetical protein
MVDNNSERKQIDGSIPGRPTGETNNLLSETPLVVLKVKRSQVTIGVLCLIFCLLGFMFGVFLPVFRTGDYSAVWGGNPVKGFILYYLSWVAIPAGFFHLLLFLHHKEGACYFYNDRLEVYTFWFERVIVIPYGRMHVVKGSMAVRISPQHVPDWSHPLKRILVMYWKSVGFLTAFDDSKIAGLRTGFNRWCENPEDGPKALQILKERAFSYKEI